MHLPASVERVASEAKADDTIASERLGGPAHVWLSLPAAATGAKAAATSTRIPAKPCAYGPAICTAKVNGSSNGSIVWGVNPPPVKVHSPLACSSIPGLPSTMTV